MREVKPTQKPVPSSDVKDLFFNSGKIDEWVSSLQYEYTDRFGKCHKTAAGMEWVFNQLVERFKVESEQALLAAGYAPAGTFQDGAEVVSRNGTVLWKLPDGDGDHYRWDGDLPKQVPAGSTPQSTGGIGKGAWVSVGDASFRSDVRNGDGSLIGLTNGTLKDAIIHVTPEMFGADPTGTIDSTLQFNELDDYLKTIMRPVLVLATGFYKINPKITKAPLGGSHARLITLYSNGSKITGGGKFIINGDISYDEGLVVGKEYYWSLVQFNANNCSVENIHFDGNGKATMTGTMPNVVNIRFQHVASFGTVTVRRKNNSITWCSGEGYGGQGVAFQYLDNAKIMHNSMSNISGMTVSGGDNAFIFDNNAEDSLDAPYALNNCTNSTVLKNKSVRTINGSGVDIVGGYNNKVFDNNIELSAGAGILIKASVQAGTAADTVTVKGNTLTKNARYTGSPAVAEILIGSNVGHGVDEASNVTVFDNTIIVDGTQSPNADRALIIGHGVSNVDFKENKIKGALNSSRVIASNLSTSSNVRISGNSWDGDGEALVSFTNSIDGFSFYDNTGMTTSDTSTLPNKGEIVSNNEVIFSNAQLITTEGISICTVKHTASLAIVHIEIEVQQVGSGGAIRRDIVVRGDSSTVSNTLVNNLIYSAGDSIPVIEIKNTLGKSVVVLKSTGNTRRTLVRIKSTKATGADITFNQD